MGLLVGGEGQQARVMMHDLMKVIRFICLEIPIHSSKFFFSSCSNPALLPSQHLQVIPSIKIVDQHELARQLPLQYNLVPNPWGQVLQSQTALQPTFNGGLSRQLLDQTQQQQRQQQQLVLQSLSNQQNNVFPSSSVPTTHTMPAGAGSSDVPQGTQQMDQLQRSLMLQQQYNHFMAPSLGTFPNNQLPFQQQMLQPVDPFLQQRLQTPLPLQLQQNLQGNPPPSGINVDGMASAAGAGAQPTRQEESTDKEESEP
mmetsp:Transcript_5739/g.9404  ORF Transcript_5739/g.9404 Transcript_5739/m.9404 type:complete len:256 (-) Transcript_5739:92-859(-)